MTEANAREFSHEIAVTRAQVMAAQLRLELDRKLGEVSSPAVRKLAAARPRPLANSS